ncbi:MAG TPA: cytochrome c-type biogenesis protein CcmH [Acidimicrobiales bacterium]|nr:cytochrome c-type biogenesis protein CcmH [Acidimicrobiales bacterium]
MRSGLLSSRPAWVAAGLLAAGLLAYGSMHSAATPAAARISYLESVIKCPNCEDLTIGQSTSQSADTLRGLVVGWVGAGRSDAWIEQQVVQHYGSDEILDPPVSGVDALVWVVPLAVVVLAVGGLVWFLLRRRRPAGSASGEAAPPEDEELVGAALAVLQGAGLEGAGLEGGAGPG